VLDGLVSDIQGVVGDSHELLDCVTNPFDRALDRIEHGDECRCFRGEDDRRNEPIENANDNFEQNFDAANDEQNAGGHGHHDIEQDVEVHPLGTHH
jgi:hypothetical protein